MKLQIQEQSEDLFKSPLSSILVHACNCKGSWSAGIANRFMSKYPQAYVHYSQLCMKQKEALLGKSEIIVSKISRKYTTEDPNSELQKYFIGCLFTSYDYGRNKDNMTEILKYTKSAVDDLLLKVTEWNKNASEKDQIKEVRMCKINAGLFNVPWDETKKVIEEISVDVYTIKTITVCIV